MRQLRPTNLWALLQQELQRQCSNASSAGGVAAGAAAAEAAAAAAAAAAAVAKAGSGSKLLLATRSSTPASSAAAPARSAAWRRQQPQVWGGPGAAAAAAAATAASSSSAAAAARRAVSTTTTATARNPALFTPSRLYPKQQRYTPEDAAFWGIVAANVAGVLVAKREAPEARAFALDHLRASVTALYEGRWHTLATAAAAHLSAVHCAINVGVLMFCRRTQQLAAGQLLALYLAGCAAGTCAHVAWHWYDAAGPAYGTRYALNTPAICGCSGGAAAVLAYKLGLAPTAMRMVAFVPVPLAFALVLYCCLEVREEEYCDGSPGKVAAAALGLLAALVTRGRSGRAGAAVVTRA